jgi:hypothetical protein
LVAAASGIGARPRLDLARRRRRRLDSPRQALARDRAQPTVGGVARGHVAARARAEAEAEAEAADADDMPG